jgi:hypothetical protein
MTFPPDALLRLLRHNENIVGATYCKRTKDANGKYPTLGKLVPPRDGKIHDGLHDALLLPGGMLLVNCGVYRRIGPPYYMEAYRFPGADRLEAYKELLRNYFWQAPPEDALAELDGTKIGAWLRDFGEVGDNGEAAQSFSEDLWFIRRTIRCGFVPKCDVRLTGQMAHLAEVPITCLLGNEVIRLPMAAE